MAGHVESSNHLHNKVLPGRNRHGVSAVRLKSYLTTSLFDDRIRSGDSAALPFFDSSFAMYFETSRC